MVWWQNKNNKISGIVSFGFHCANPNLLGVYTDVSQYIEWIEEKTGVKALMEQSNSTSDESVEVSTKPQKPHQVHVVHESLAKPSVIIIIRNHNKSENHIENKSKVVHRLVKKKYKKNKKLKIKNKIKNWLVFYCPKIINKSSFIC